MSFLFLLYLLLNVETHCLVPADIPFEGQLIYWQLNTDLTTFGGDVYDVFAWSDDEATALFRYTDSLGFAVNQERTQFIISPDRVYLFETINDEPRPLFKPSETWFFPQWTANNRLVFNTTQNNEIIILNLDYPPNELPFLSDPFSWIQATYEFPDVDSIFRPNLVEPAIYLSPDEQSVVLFVDNTIRLIDLTTGEILWQAEDVHAQSIRWAPDSSSFVYGTPELTHVTIDGVMQTLSIIPATTVRWSTNGRYIAYQIMTGNTSNELYIYDLQSQLSYDLCITGNFIWDIVWSPDGDQFIYQQGNMIFLVDVNNFTYQTLSLPDTSYRFILAWMRPQ